MGIGEVFWDKVEPYAEKISIYDGSEVFLEQFNLIPQEVRHLYAANFCQSEICNGGFIQFFFNSTGVLAPEAVEGFRAIGLDDVAAVVDEAMKFFHEPYPRSREKRQDLMGFVNGIWAVNSLFDELDTKFYKLIEHGRFYKAADEYASHI